MFAAAALFGLHVIWACGGFERLGLGGFAYAGDVDKLRGEVMSIKVELVEQRIFESRVRQCESDSGASRFYRGQLQELMRKYRELTGSDYELPACDEL